jgi:hypothetical protein
VLSRVLRGARPSWVVVSRRCRVLAAFVGHLPRALVDRRRLRRRRVVADADVLRWMVTDGERVVGLGP